jgi:hypothetical protein
MAYLSRLRDLAVDVLLSTYRLTLCRSYLNPYCLGRKTAFFSVGMQNQKQASPTGEEIITIKLKKTE